MPWLRTTRTTLLFALCIGCGHQASGPAIATGSPPTTNSDPNALVIKGPNLGPAVAPSPVGQFSSVRGMFGKSDAPDLTVLGDCNGDGLLDAFRPAEGKLFVQEAAGTFHDNGVLLPPGAHPAAPFNGGLPGNLNGAFFDADGDGKLDLVYARLDALDLLLGHGDCTFDAPRSLAPACHQNQPVQLTPLDVDQDGLIDLAVTCASKVDGLARILVARGDLTFDAIDVPSGSLIGTNDSYPSFGMFLDDIDGDGALDGFFLAEFNLGWFAWGVPGDLPAFKRDDLLSELVAYVDGMSFAPLDVDRDGRMDYFMSSTQAMNRLWWTRGGRKLNDIGPSAGLVGGSAIHWASFASDFDFDGWPDILVLRLAQIGINGGNPDQPEVYFSQHNGTFVDMAASVLDPALKTEAEVLACGDLRSDGRVGCFVANHMDMTTPELSGTLLLHNDIEPKGGWIGVRLRGTVSANNGALARVALEGSNPPQVLLAGGQGPAGELHDSRVLLSTGQATQADVAVTWPSGITQHAKSLPVKAYATLEEPRVLTVAQRIAPADGQTLVDVVLDPAAAGATAATVDVTGAGTWQGPLAAGADGKLHRQLLAPKAPGTARIAASLDGKPLLVRPRIRFE